MQAMKRRIRYKQIDENVPTTVWLGRQRTFVIEHSGIFSTLQGGWKSDANLSGGKGYTH